MKLSITREAIAQRPEIFILMEAGNVGAPGMKRW
jgi:hypothetical protein